MREARQGQKQPPQTILSVCRSRLAVPLSPASSASQQQHTALRHGSSLPTHTATSRPPTSSSLQVQLPLFLLLFLLLVDPDRRLSPGCTRLSERPPLRCRGPRRSPGLGKTRRFRRGTLVPGDGGPDRLSASPASALHRAGCLTAQLLPPLLRQHGSAALQAAQERWRGGEGDSAALSSSFAPSERHSSPSDTQHTHTSSATASAHIRHGHKQLN